ncbi:MAG: dynamin family protein [Proteobacteria bacterium]|nr:dynamin family protein [Pseudomonadota bacterium]
MTITVTHSDHIAELKDEILKLISDDLNPLRSHYQFGQHDLHSFISWKPMVLIIGNYSAGKSTLINEILGEEIQRTGQAPTDDCFTVISYQDNPSKTGVEERDGRVLMGDASLPFIRLKSQGERFLSHFRLKKIRVDLLKNLTIIDTPGMLDSISEKDRGYNYQEVLGELASLSDLVIIIFDSHKAGTVRESYQSLRTTLPQSTMEDRVLFVLNRVDECQSLDDLVRVHGALCWNISQMTGRKDIPRIYLTYAPPGGTLDNVNNDLLKAYLKEVASQKQELIYHILDIPRKRIDHLATYIDIHGHRIYQFIAACQSFRVFKRKANGFLIKSLTLATLTLIASGFLFFSPSITPVVSYLGGWLLILMALIITIAALCSKLYLKHSKFYFLKHINKFINIESQYEQDHWSKVAPEVLSVIKQKEKYIPPLKQIGKDMKEIINIQRRVVYLRDQISKMSPDRTVLLSTPSLTSPSATATKTRLTLLDSTQDNKAPDSSGGGINQIIGEQIDQLNQPNSHPSGLEEQE